jgi:hypothetical protein
MGASLTDPGAQRPPNIKRARALFRPFGRFTKRHVAVIALVSLILMVAACHGGSSSPHPNCSDKLRDLTGAWSANDGGLYFIRQIGATISWVGLSVENQQAQPTGSQDWHLGIDSTSVFRGNLLKPPADPYAPRAMTGDWAFVPRGTTNGNGSLTLLANCSPSKGLSLLKVPSSNDDFQASVWHPTRVGFPYSDRGICNIYCRFTKVARNDYGTLQDHLKHYKDYFTLYGYLAPGPGLENSSAWVYWPSEGLQVRDSTGRVIDRSFGHFSCAKQRTLPLGDAWWFSGEDPPDGDLNLYIAELPYANNWLRPFAPIPPVGKDWQYVEPGSGKFRTDPETNEDKPPPSLNGFKAEAIMYGSEGYIHGASCTPHNRVALMPGWADSGANSVLVNGRPINGSAEAGMPIIEGARTCHEGNLTGRIDPEHPGWCAPLRIGSWVPSSITGRLGSCPASLPQAACPDREHGISWPPNLVRITGTLVRDCHEGDCKDPWELHPVYSIDAIAPSSSSIAGVWAGNNEATYYVSEFPDQDGTREVWWLGWSQDEGGTFASVFHGTFRTDAPFPRIEGEWANVFGAQGSGSLTLTLTTPCSGKPFADFRASACASLNASVGTVPPATRLAKLYG